MGNDNPIMDWLSAAAGGDLSSQQTRDPASDPSTPQAAPTPTPAQKLLANKGLGSTVDPATKALLMQLLSNQQGDVQKQRDIADQYEKLPKQVNLAPLAGLVDSWTGSSFAKTLPEPPSPEQKLMQLAQLRKLAAGDQQQLTKDQISLLNSGNKDDTALSKALLALAGKNNNGPDWRVDRLMSQAADTVHKAPNMKTYTDLTNSVAESLYVLNKPDATVTEAHEALQNITRAIGRSNVNSDYKQKQLSMPTVEEMGKNLLGMLTSDPNQLAPEETKKLLLKVGNRVLDTYDSSIKREANRVTQGRIGKFRVKEANDAMQQARDFYTSGQYMNELRDQYGIHPSELPPQDKDLKPVTTAGLGVQKPDQVDPADWAAATAAEKQALSNHFGKPKAKK